MTFARIIGFFLLVLTANAIAGQKAQYYVDDTWDGSNEASLSHYHSPQEACVVGVMQRKVHGYQEGASLRFRYRSVFVGTDDGFSEYACQGVIEKQLYIVGANWVTVEAVATNVNGPFDAPESCTPSGTGDGNQCGGSKCNDCCCSGQGTSGASPPPANKPNVGNPIDASTGNKHQVETDFTGSGLFPLHFERTYDSNRTWFNNPVPIGIAWTHSYLGHIDVLPTQGNSTLTEAVVHRPDGSTLRFNLVAGVWTADADVPVRLSVALDASGVAFATLTDTNDTVETYDQLGRLVSITNRDGLTQSLSYTTTSGGSTISHNDVQQVSDPQGRVLTFEYNASGQVANITDGNGSAIQYGYDSGTGNLASVIYPDIGGTTKTRNYLYNEAGQVVGSWPNALTGISEEITTGSFQRFASWGYDNVGRAIFSVHGPYATGTIDKTSLSFNGDGTTTFTDALGQTRTYGFAVSYTVARPSSLDVACDTCASHDKSRGYDSNGYANASTDFNGNKATYHFAALDASGHPRGLETQRVEGIPPTGSTDISAKRTINTQWDPNFRVPAKQDILDSSSTIVQTTKWKYNLRGQPTFRCLIDPKVTGASSYNCGSQANAPSGVRQWAWTYCETGGGCPLVGIVLTSKGPRSDAATTYTYFPTTDLSGCATGGVCHRLGDVQTITAQVNASSTLTTTVATYDGNGRPTRILDSNGVPTDLSYHPRGWLTQRVVRNVNSGTNANDRITTWTYNGAGKVTQVTHPIGDYEIFGYDIAHRLTDVTNKMNEHMHFVLDAAGNRAEEDYYNASNVIKHKVLRDFDVLGRLHDTKNAYVTPASLAMTYSYVSERWRRIALGFRS